MITSASGLRSWIASTSARLTRRRIRVHATVLAVCLWGVCAVDYATPGVFDRAGNIKFQDFIQFSISGRLIAQGRSNELYSDQVLAEGVREIAGNTRVRLQYFYGPQVALAFVPFGRISFLTQASLWMAGSLLIYFGCVYVLWISCPAQRSYPGLAALCAVAYPSLFHFFVRGQLSAIVLLCFTGAYVAFLFQRDWLAGIALGCLIFKPQFLVAIPLLLLLAHAWKAFAGLVASAGLQLAFTFLYFGPAVMRSYGSMLLHSASRPGSTELSLSPIQMHSLRSFWELLIPLPSGVWVLYALSSLAVIGIAVAVWRSSSPLGLRFSALVLAAVLVNPHIYIYDLLALVPALIFLADWALNNPQHPSTPVLRLLLYLAFLLPLFGPLARWTHVQLSVVVFLAILWVLYSAESRTGKLAFAESRGG